MEKVLIRKIIISSVIGGLAVFLFSNFYLLLNPESLFTYLHVIIFTAVSIAVSALVTMIGSLVDERLIKAGIESNLLRQLIVMTTAMIIVGTAVGIISLNYDIFGFQPERLFILVGLTGFLVAGIMIFVENKIWQMRKEMLELEIRNTYLEELNQQDKLLEAASKKLIVSEERNRMARELHDSIAQGLNGINYSLNTLKKKIGSSDQDNLEILPVIDHLEETTEETLKELRDLILELKPSVIENKGLEQAVQSHCQLFARRQEIELNMDIARIANLSPELELAIFRIVQEALANVQKHSQADRVKVYLKEIPSEKDSEAESRIILRVADNGRGFTEENIKSSGIANMKTRAQQNNGSLKIDSKPGKGTSIEASFTVV